VKVSAPPPSGSGGSLLRVLIGTLLCIAAVAVTIYGFVTLIRVLESDGYGTPAMRWALTILGVAGASLAGGIATLIWDVAKRYELGRK
jgi:hypothetical protein